VEGSGIRSLPSKNVSVLRAALVFALLISACRSGPPTEGWSEVARASGVVPNQSGVTECRWDLPCQRVESGVFSTTGRPLRLVCTGMVDLLFVEYFHGPEPHSGNGWLCPSEGTSSILLLPPRSRASLYLAAARVPLRDAGEDSLPWSLSIQEWKGVGVENSIAVACCPARPTHSCDSSSSSGDAPVSTTTVWSSNEHHSLSILSDRSRGHSAGSVYHPFSSCSKSSS
jgi:hypothetical protein